MEWQGFRHLKTTFRFQGERPLFYDGDRLSALGSAAGRSEFIEVWRLNYVNPFPASLPASKRQPLRNILATWEKEPPFWNFKESSSPTWTSPSSIFSRGRCGFSIRTSSSHHWSKFEELSYFLTNHTFISFHHLSTPLVFSHPSPKQKPDLWRPNLPSTALRLHPLRLRNNGVSFVDPEPYGSQDTWVPPGSKKLGHFGMIYKPLPKNIMVPRKQTYKKNCAWTSRLLDCNFFSCGSVGVCLKGGGNDRYFLVGRSFPLWVCTTITLGVNIQVYFQGHLFWESCFESMKVNLPFFS